MSDIKLRTKDFKIGKMHGKNLNENDKREARIRNDLFFVGKLLKEEEVLSIIGYEIPLEEGRKRGGCIDLLCVDKKRLPYIIELKRKGSRENLKDVKEQIERYGKYFSEIREYIEKEIGEKYFNEEWKINTDKVVKIILAPREYFENRKKELKQKNIRDAAKYFYCLNEDEVKKSKLLRDPIKIQQLSLKDE